MPATIAITIIAAALRETPRVSCAWIATRTRRSRNAGTTPRPAVTTISSSSPRAAPVRLEERPDPAQVRAPHLRVGRPLGRASPVVEEHPHRAQGTRRSSGPGATRYVVGFRPTPAGPRLDQRDPDRRQGDGDEEAHDPARVEDVAEHAAEQARRDPDQRVVSIPISCLPGARVERARR